MDYSLAILIPCHSEEITIKKVVLDFFEVFKNHNCKIYVYDNNSNDKSAEVVKSIKLPNLYYRFEEKVGKGNVIKRMFREIDADYYLLVDGDDTYPAKSAVCMLEAMLNEKPDMIVGDRLSVNYHSENKRLFHSFGNNLVKNFINFLFKTNLNDIMSGYRLLNKRTVKTLCPVSEGFEIETEMTILALDFGYKIKEIPVEYKERIEGSKSKLNTYKDGICVLKTIFILFKDYKPFEFFSFLSFILLLISIVLFAPVFVQYLKTGMVLRFPTLFVSIFFAIFSILMFSTGLILSVIIKMFKRSRELLLNSRG